MSKRCVLLALCLLIPACVLAVETKGLTLLVQPERPVYSQREPIAVALKVTNESSTLQRLGFSSGQRFELLVRDAQGREVWRWSSGKVFTQVMAEVTVNPSAELIFKATVPGTLPAGSYELIGRIPALGSPLEARAAVTVQ